ncbi:hypothetical protein ACFE04_030326 [Oxalis oulophora]
MPSAPIATTIVSRSCVVPDQTSDMESLKLSVSDLPMLSCHYIQKGCLFTRPQNISIDVLLSSLRAALANTLSHIPPLAGRLFTDHETKQVFIKCNDQGVEFVHATALHLLIRDVIGPSRAPECVKGFFACDRMVSYSGHFNPIVAVQVTELADGIFIGCSANHAVMDGTSFWNFFNTFAELSKGVKKVSKLPDFDRNCPIVSKTAVLSLPDGGPKVSFNESEPLSERMFSFSKEAMMKIKARANNKKMLNDEIAIELLGKQSNDFGYDGNGNGLTRAILENWFFKKPVQEDNNKVINETVEISSFQSLCALLWRAVTRARKLPGSKTTTFRMAVNCRHRLEPKLDPFYFGNAIQSIPTCATADDVLSRDLNWCGTLLNKSVKAHDNASIRRVVENWEKDPRVFPLGNFDGASMTMGSSPRFPMYDNDFGWGRPLAVRSGKANKFDGKISAFPGRDGNGTVDLEVVLAPETMDAIESDYEFMQYVS